MPRPTGRAKRSRTSEGPSQEVTDFLAQLEQEEEAYEPVDDEGDQDDEDDEDDEVKPLQHVVSYT